MIKIKIQIRLPQERALALRWSAQQQGISAADPIRLSMDATLHGSEAVDLKAQREKAIAAAGKLHGSFLDLSIQHDNYLAESFGEADLNYVS